MSNAAKTSCSVRRLASGIVGRVSTIIRSSRSERLAMSSIDVSSTGRCARMTVSPASLYLVRAV